MYKGALHFYWPSSFSFIPTDALGSPVYGDWDSDAGVSEICSLSLLAKMDTKAARSVSFFILKTRRTSFA
jgi:hypothetical protein